MVFANVVTEERLVYSETVSGKPSFGATELGSQFHVTIIKTEAMGGPQPHIRFNYVVSLEYRFQNGFDYCHIEGVGTVPLSEKTAKSTCSLTVVDVSASLAEVNVTEGMLSCTLTVHFLTRYCTERYLNVLLASSEQNRRKS